MICAPRCSALWSFPTERPPYKRVTCRPCAPARLSTTPPTWMANSRVGTRTSALYLPGGRIALFYERYRKGQGFPGPGAGLANQIPAFQQGWYRLFLYRRGI